MIKGSYCVDGHTAELMGIEKITSASFLNLHCHHRVIKAGVIKICAPSGQMTERILIVDDDADVLVAAKLLLKRHFGNVVTANRPAHIPALLGKAVQQIHRCALAEEVHRDNGLGSLGNLAFNLPDVDVVGFRIDIYKYRNGTLVKNAVCRARVLGPP